MQNSDWQELNNIQLGQFAKHYAMTVFSSYGFTVSELRSRNPQLDFSISRSAGPAFDVKVRSVRGRNYIYFQKEKFILRPSLYAVLAIYNQNELPELFMIPSLAWLQPDALLVSYDYVGKKSKPEWGVNLSEKNQEILERFQFARMIPELS